MSDRTTDWNDHLDSATRPGTAIRDQVAELTLPALTILAHPDPDRAGERATLPALLSGRAEKLSRLEPLFAHPQGGEARPLADPRLSRTPLLLTPGPDSGIELDARSSSMAILVDEAAVGERSTVSRVDLERGVVLLLARRVALLLHVAANDSDRPPAFGLVGESAPILRVRREIERLAKLPYTTLLRGESGTGKELVARALHRAGPRSRKTYLSVNVGAIPPTLAASELFGAAAGAYSGASHRRRGYFQRADGGTLFLDEIGATPPEVQVPLLRVLETWEIQPVGAERPTEIDVQVITATDEDLDAAIGEGRFRAALYHRLTSYQIVLPPLRQRREDFGRLFFHFLRRELDDSGDSENLRDPGPDGRPWVPAELVAHLARLEWPGNVRQLRNVVRRLVVQGRGEPQLPTTVEITSLGPEPRSPREVAERREAPARPAESPASYRDPSEVSESELRDALHARRWNLKATAAALCLSRGSLYALIEQSPRIRKASDLGRDEIERAIADCSGRLEAMVDRLEVSKRGLQMRIKELGLRTRPERLRS